MTESARPSASGKGGMDHAGDLAAMALMFHRLGLTIPFCPSWLAFRIRETAPAVFSSHPLLNSLFRLEAIEEWWRSGFPEAALAFGRQGYGLASQCLQAAISGPALAMAGEVPFGNFYADQEEERRNADAMLEPMIELYQLSYGCLENEKFPGERWIVIQPSDRIGLWRRLSADGGTTDVETYFPIEEALAEWRRR